MRRAGPFLFLVLAAAPARGADSTAEKKACAEASEEAQLRRIHGQLTGAREQLLVCSRDVCPPLVKHDCDQWLADVEASLPTIVLSARDAQGNDVGNVRVLVDDKPYKDNLDGKATAIDPGQHVLRFEHPGSPPLVQQLIVREGEKNRLVAVAWQRPAPAVPVSPPTAVRSEGSPGAAFTVLGLSLIGAGAVGLGFAAYFEVASLNDYSTLKNGCSKTDSCSQSSVDAISRERVESGVALGLGIAAAGAGTVLLIVRPRRASDAQGAWMRIAPRPGGAAASFGVSF